MFHEQRVMTTEWPVNHTVHGSLGDSFPPGSPSSRYVFSTDMAMPLNFQHQESLTRDGIKMHRYRVDKMQFDYAPDWDMNLRGYVNLTRQKQTTLYLSKPHFYDALDDWTTGKIIGMLPPDQSRDDTYLDIEPLTGATMHARKRIQANLYLPPKAEHNWLNKFNPLVPTGQFYPVMWIDERGDITPKLAKEFKDQVYMAVNLGTALTYVGFIVGALAFTTGCVLLIFEIRTRSVCWLCIASTLCRKLHARAAQEPEQEPLLVGAHV